MVAARHPEQDVRVKVHTWSWSWERINRDIVELRKSHVLAGEQRVRRVSLLVWKSWADDDARA